MESISPTFYESLLGTKHKALLHLLFRFELYLAQEHQRKCTHKMLMKLTTGVNFAFILGTPIWPVGLCYSFFGIRYEVDSVKAVLSFHLRT